MVHAFVLVTMSPPFVLRFPTEHIQRLFPHRLIMDVSIVFASVVFVQRPRAHDKFPVRNMQQQLRHLGGCRLPARFRATREDTELFGTHGFSVESAMLYLVNRWRHAGQKRYYLPLGSTPVIYVLWPSARSPGFRRSLWCMLYSTLFLATSISSLLVLEIQSHCAECVLVPASPSTAPSAYLRRQRRR